MPAKRFKELLSGGPAIFVPTRSNARMTEVVDGLFLGGGEVCCNDPSKTFKKYGPVLPAGKKTDWYLEEMMSLVKVHLYNSKEPVDSETAHTWL